MQKDATIVLTKIVLSLSIVISITMLVFTVLIGIVVKAIPPVVVTLITTLFFIWIDIFYLNCYRWLRGKTAEGKMWKGLKRQNTVLLVIMACISFSMWLFLLVSCVIYQVFVVEVYAWLIFVACMSTVYTINGLMIAKRLKQHG